MPCRFRRYRKNCESNDSEPHDGVPLNTEMIGESTAPSVTNIQCILHKLEEVITAKHYSTRTREAYSYWISRFIREHKDKNLKTLSETEINSFVSRLAVKENAAASSQNQALSALLLKSPENIVRAKKQKKLPAVLSREETAKIFSLLPENDHGLFIRLLYGRYNFGSCNTAASLTDEFAMRQTSHMIYARSAH